MAKIKMSVPLVEMDGDEMNRVICSRSRKYLSNPMWN